MENASLGTPDYNSTGKGAFIVGLIGLVLSFVPIIGFVAWLLGPISIIMGLIALRKSPRGLAIAGIVTGGLALFICFGWISLSKSVGEAMNQDTFTSAETATTDGSRPILDANIRVIWDDIEANKIAAGAKYGGSRLRFTDAKINDFQGDAQSPAINFEANRSDYLIHFVTASFRPADSEKIGKMKKGQSITFVCDSIKETYGDGYSLSGCAL